MENSIFFIVIAVLLSVFLVFFFVFPVYKNFTSDMIKISERKSDLQSYDKNLEELKKTKEELDKYKEQVSKIETAIPPSVGLPEYLDLIQRTASQSGLILEISPASTGPAEKGKLRETRTSFILKGDYSGFKGFLTALEKSARFIEVEDVSFGSPAKMEDLFSFSMTTKVYSY